MLYFQLIYWILFVIPLINTILDDDILYDIKWQPELISVGRFYFTMKKKGIFIYFFFSQLNLIIVIYLHLNERKIIYVFYQHLKQRF
jgi:hypothetical protein